METSKSPMSTSLTLRESSYQALTANQDPLGYFEALPSNYKSLADTAPPSELAEMVVDPNMVQIVWTTILVLLLLDRDCKDTEGEWKMIAKKARTFIKKQGIKDYQSFSIPMEI